MHAVGKYAYGLWLAVFFNIVVFGLFAYSVFRPTPKGTGVLLGRFMLFLVALFCEMFGFSLTVYILTSMLGSRYPVLDPFTHMNGHLWLAFTGGSPVVFSILHPLSNILIFGGLIIIFFGGNKFIQVMAN